MQFYVYTKTPITCSYHIEEADSLDALAEKLRANMISWQVAKVFGYTRVKLDNMPHKNAILIAGNRRNFIAVEDAALVKTPEYSDGEAYWILR